MDHRAFRQEVIKMQHKLNSIIDDRNASVSREINSGFQKLEDDLEMGKNKSSIHHDLKRLRDVIRKNDGVAMDHHDSDQIEKWLDKAIQKYR